jgi:nicotinamidase-related amidase
VSDPGRLVVVDLRHVFGDPDSEWTTPRFEEVRPRVRELARAFGERVVWTRFVAPAEPTGAWARDYERSGFALRPADDPLYRLVTDACAGASDDDDDRALAVLGTYAPLVALVTTHEVLTELTPAR